ncbi:MAG: 1-acyl-sn-glycerol-3-phosphate acyltransferase [Clostridia bacterium]|nr:1-acyl-sn-glycerol-3-phosphate acyltransferase [Clostridia bacterium]
MKIRNAEKSYLTVAGMERPAHKRPKKPNLLFRTLLKLVSLPDLIITRFRCRKIGMERLGRKEPCLILMNHSSFIDLKIASSVLYPRAFNIVATLDAFVGKNWLMRQLGCIPTRKFVFDIGLVRDISHCIKKLGTSVLMYPEAGYSFDGTATTLPDSLGKFVKMLGAPLVMLETFGAYHRDPLYNELQKRKVRVSAELRYVLSAEEIKGMTSEEIGEVIAREFSFDNFRWQQENMVRIDEPFRADGLERVLYKCPHCLAEGRMTGKGERISCGECGKAWRLTEYGFMEAENGETEFAHIPDWYAWERGCVKAELDSGTYGFTVPVDIYMIVNTKGVYKVGSGELTHSEQGFHLTGCDGQLDYRQNSVSLYTLNSDFYWYRLGDVIGIGNHDALYYCFPENDRSVVPKARLATEEIYKKLRDTRSGTRN